MNNTMIEFDIFKDENGRTIIQIGKTSFVRLLWTIGLIGLTIGTLLVTSIAGLII